LTASNEAVKPFERTWLVLVKLFEELVAHGVELDASALRDSKTLLHLIRTTPSDPCSGPMSESGNLLLVLGESLERAKAELITASLKLGEARSNYWRERVSRAELEDTEQFIVYGESRFFPGLPRNPRRGWARLTLQKPIGEGRLQDVAEQFGVLVEFEDDLHLLFEGEPSLVKKALADVYYLSQP
jgi:hypothetical protein